MKLEDVYDFVYDVYEWNLIGFGYSVWVKSSFIWDRTDLRSRSEILSRCWGFGARKSPGKHKWKEIQPQAGV